MNAFLQINELNRVIRQHLIEQSELAPDRVLNALSMHGEELSKLIEESTYLSISTYDAMLLFELQSRDSSSDISFCENDSLISIRSFTLKLILYGQDSSDIATRLKARFESQELRNSLHNVGIYIEKISNPSIFNEYKNQTMWIRNDIDIDISCKFLTQKITKDFDFEKNSLLNISTIKEI